MTITQRADWIRNHSEPPVLEVGCADGYIYKGWDKEDLVTRLDLDTYSFPRGKFVQGNAENLPFLSNNFETVVLAEVLEHVRDVGKTLREAYRVTRYQILYTTPNEYRWGKDKYPFRKEEEAMIQDIGSADRTKWFDWYLHRQPNLQAIYPEESYPHLFHVRYFTEETLRHEIEKVTLNYTLELTDIDGFAYFLGTIIKK